MEEDPHQDLVLLQLCLTLELDLAMMEILGGLEAQMFLLRGSLGQKESIVQDPLSLRVPEMCTIDAMKGWLMTKG